MSEPADLEPPTRAHLWAGLLALVCGLFLVHVSLRSFACDDGAILWRYAKHFSEGHGFRYNIEDEPVEGCSNLPFAVVMSLGFRGGVDPEVFTNVSGLVLGTLTLLLVHALGRRGGLAPPFALLAVAALAANPSFAAWATGGLGTRFYTVFVLLALIRVLVEDQQPTRSTWLSGLLFGIVAIIRPEGMAFFAIVLAWRFLHRRGLRPLVVFAMSFAVLKIAQVGFQLAYFGSPLPNTYYAKVNGIWLGRGLWFLGKFGLAYSMWLVVPLAIVGCFARGSQVLGSRFCLWVAACFALAIAMIGGGRHEFRMIDAVFPLVYLAAAGGVDRLSRHGANASAGVVVGVLVMASSFGGVFVARTADFYTTRDFVSPAMLQANFEYAKEIGHLFKRHFEPTDRIARRAAGAIPLYSELYTLDVHGLNDRVIAHRPIEGEREIYAHEKMAIEEDYERARIDYKDIQVAREHPVLDYARKMGLVEQIAGLPLEPDSVPANLRAALRQEKMLCVFVEEGYYLYMWTRLPAETYRERWRERGYAVLF